MPWAESHACDSVRPCIAQAAMLASWKAIAAST